MSFLYFQLKFKISEMYFVKLLIALYIRILRTAVFFPFDNAIHDALAFYYKLHSNLDVEFHILKKNIFSLCQRILEVNNRRF